MTTVFHLKVISECRRKCWWAKGTHKYGNKSLSNKLPTLNFPRGCQGNSTPGQQLWRWKEPYFCFLNLLPTASPLGNAIAAAITVRLEQVALSTGQCTAAPVLCPCSGLGQLRPLHIPQRGSPGSLLSAGRAGLCAHRGREAAPHLVRPYGTALPPRLPEAAPTGALRRCRCRSGARSR